MDRGGGGRPRIPAHISDEALDDYVTELILEEARMKDPAYQRDYQRYVCVCVFDLLTLDPLVHASRRREQTNGSLHQ